MNTNFKENYLRDFELSEVKITDKYFKNALDKEIIYLKKFEEERLVAGFLETRGLKTDAIKYPGWEVLEIRGHSLGHYLTAVAQAYATTKDEEILQKIIIIINELEKAQFENGYLSAFSEEFFTNVETGKPCWVPWYTMDKIIAGLTSVYKFTKNEKALEIVYRLGLWVYERTSKWSKEMQDTVLAVEYGGMNEAMYQLYMITKEEKHEKAAHAFDEVSLFEPVKNNIDILNGKHANTTIPKFLGALERYIAHEGEKEEEFYFESASVFWDMVLEHHTYITGGNSEWEHFGEPLVLDKERTNCNCETCNTYNMLKLSRELFKITKDKKYLDFYENTFINAIMSSQNPDTGMTMYFQPMATGYFKVYSTEFDSFWCCTGTGMENFTKLNDSLYFYNNDTVFVNQYISSSINNEEMGLYLNQLSNIPNTTKTSFEIESKKDIKIAFRVPDWAAGEISVNLNNGKAKVEVIDGFIYIDIKAKEKYNVELDIPMNITIHRLPDNENVIALKYGPIVLSSALGKEDMVESKTGVDVTIATRNIDIKDFITIPDMEVEEWINDINNQVVKAENSLEFRLKNTDSSHLIFTPHYKQHEQRYGIYWNIVSKNSKALQKHILNAKVKARMDRVSIDSVPLGNDQYELLHNIKGEDTGAVTFNGLMLRHAWGENGWFSYEMKVDDKFKNYIVAKYFSPNAGRTFNIYVDGELLIEETIKNKVVEDFYDEYYEIPEEMIKGKEKITILFKTRGDSFVGGMFDKLLILKDYNNQAGLESLNIKNGELDRGFNTQINTYNVRLNSDKEIVLSATLRDKFGLLYINEILVDDTSENVVSLNKEDKVVIKAYAEDHINYQEYIINIL